MNAHPHNAVDERSPVSSERLLDYHPRALGLGPDGVRGFFMPVSEDAADRLLKTILAAAARYLKDVGIDSNRTAEAIWLMLIYIALDAVTTFVLAETAAGNAARGITAVYDGEDGALTRLARGQPFASAVALRLQERQFNPSLKRTWGRYARSLLRGADVARKPPVLIDQSHDILCFAAEPWHRHLAAQAGRRLVLSHPENWLSDFARELNSPSEQLDPEPIAAMLDIVATAFRAGGAATPTHVLSSLHDNIRAIVRTAAAMRAAVERKHRYLPRAFWATSMGPGYNRVVARVVQKAGGAVTAFDHGTGCGWMDSPELMALEWDFCDTFVAFSETNAAAINGLLVSGRIYGATKGRCAVTASPVPLYDTSLSGRGIRRCGGKTKLSVWYVPTHYTQEQTYLPPIATDIVEVDFQARVLRHLRDLGHEVVVKPHPGCKVGFPTKLLEQSNARLETRSFEAVATEPDVVLLDYPQSTTFRSAIIAGIPIVVLDPGRVPFLPEAMDLLRGSASVVPITRDAENRRRVDPAALAAAVAEALRCTSDAFQRAYYPVA